MIIGFTGQSRSGKNTAAQALEGYTQVAFADALRYVVEEALLVEVTETNKEQPGHWLKGAIEKSLDESKGVSNPKDWIAYDLLVSLECAYSEYRYCELSHAAIQALGTLLQESSARTLTPRRILQVVGTDIFRAWDSECWVKALDAQIVHLDNVVVTDVRFPNEVDYIHKRGGIVIRIVRPDTDKPAPEHVSEDVGALQVDHEIYNTDTVKGLRHKVRQLNIS